MISLEEALERIFIFAQPLPHKLIDIQNAAGRVAAAPVTAKTSQPPFDASAMDGYAVRSADLGENGATLLMIGASQAGDGFEGTVGPGQCTRIFTGAPVPDGADAVIMQEKASVDGIHISFAEAAAPNLCIRNFGQDFKDGQILLEPGMVLTPAAIALAAAANNAQIDAFAKPKVGILATGDELVPPGTPLAPDQIIASNSVALSALLSPLCSSVADLGIAQDNVTDLRAKLDTALNSDADVIITTGGASVGDHDLVQPVLKSLGVEIDFWKIAIRPGKPLMFGKKGDKLVFGLPGNPVSSMVTSTILVLPALRALAGYKSPAPEKLHLQLATPLPANGPRRHFIRAKIQTSGTGMSSVAPISETDSAHLSSMHAANALIIHPEGAPAKQVGEIVTLIPL